MHDLVAIKGKNILVVGASGFLGRPLATRLAAGGSRVCAVCRKSPEADAENIHWAHGDAADAEFVNRLFSSFRPAVVFHLASDSQGGRALSLLPGSVHNDLVATINVLHGAASADAKVERFVMTASLEEPEGAEPTPMSPYAAAKWAASGYGRMFRHLYDLDVRVVRPMMTFGPGQKEWKFVPSTILSLLANQRIAIGSGSRLVDWVYLDDVVEGLLAAACVPDVPTTVDLGSGALVSVADVAREIGRQLGRTHLLQIGDGARGEEIVRVGDAAKARELLGFSATTSLPDGIARAIAFYSDAVRQPGRRHIVMPSG
ncbi:NAD(P)-dependent oxidoreductase [Bradyrhizobium sp. LHD-71]|uniref:NAD-dependent epimerase/dehydratase family protein n=1 Tax=Bradyrhizobium sp. LHD-71 TaxID=3072141 RepID=UPI0028105875|nr:NAD(P)-dependent oxidoreductase [Bradyrhizobium sp. LHD-71]MDQ8728055.1 NAD(P)-dependent oxidoreductase [Bradyrhizobium sp. LHD-71]